MLLIILLIILLVFGGVYGRGAGWYTTNAPYAFGGTGLLGALILILIVLALLGRI